MKIHEITFKKKRAEAISSVCHSQILWIYYYYDCGVWVVVIKEKAQQVTVALTI